MVDGMSVTEQSHVSGRTKSSSRRKPLKKGWSKLKKTVKSVRRIFSRKPKSPDVTQPSQLQTTQVSIAPSEYQRDNLNIAYIVDNNSSKQSKSGIESFLSDKQRARMTRCCRSTLTSLNHSLDRKRAKFRRLFHTRPITWPEVAPPSTTKSELFSGTELFRHLDRRALQFAKCEWTDLKRMSRKLTRNCTSDLEKARVLFRWVVARDLIVRNAGDLNWTVSTVNDVTNLKHSRELFHRLFQIVCRYAGLPCEIIRGYSKGAGYKPGMRIRGESFRNSWTAVAIDGTWRLVNVTWAARQVDNVELTSCDEFYFLTDPSEHIFQHFPDNPKWQLLEEPLPFSEFTKLPLVWSPFFNNDLRFSDCYSSSIVSDNGTAEIRLIVPENIKLGSHLKPSRHNRVSGATGVTLEHTKNEAIFTVLSRQPGLFYFYVYASESNQSQSLENACSFAVKFKPQPEEL